MLLQILNSQKGSLRTNSFLEMKKHTLIHLYILRLIVIEVSIFSLLLSIFSLLGKCVMFQVLYLFDILKFLPEINRTTALHFNQDMEILMYMPVVASTRRKNLAFLELI